jgi:hypothetical protein
MCTMLIQYRLLSISCLLKVPCNVYEARCQDIRSDGLFELTGQIAENRILKVDGAWVGSDPIELVICSEMCSFGW